MEFKLTNIDPYNCSIEELKAEIDRLKSIKEEYYNLEQSIKIFINSVYGATASVFFVGYNVNVAEAVTLQGQDIAKFASRCIDDYFMDYWHNDAELHKALGLTYANKINEQTVTVYMDTDSVHSDSIVHTDKGSIKIEDWYNKNKTNGGTTLEGHESVLTNDKILNWDNELYFAPVKRIIRHKVTKPKWKIKTKSGKEIIITNDHSLIVFRNNEKLEIKPQGVIYQDKVLCLGTKFYFDEIESCEEMGTFDNEYVYDVEVDDDTHTFIANDILVHNSCYVTFDPMLKSCDYQGNPVDFILKVKELRLTSFIKKKYEEYAKRHNTKNIQDLELEKISYSAIMVAKKKYVLDLAWKDPGVHIEPQENIKFVGIEIVQGSTPKYARQVLKELIKMTCSKGKKTQYADVVNRLKEYKKEYVLQNPEDIAKTQALGNYEKYCLEDKREVVLAEKCPQNVRASAMYNHQVLNSKKWKTKYNIIKTGDKVKFYYSKDGNEVFGFLPGNFPYEFAPEVDYDLQFEKTIIEQFNRILTTIGFNPVPGNLIYAKALF